ncbi:PAS domain S-box protein [Spirosoma sp. HMF3257]|uniref:histidine kinase n=1 Tax=Spirosoma telluris TaxID=2183553 RepID=A0A327NU78_9BACT|nr:PAS domain S-box protein [Spirosoma telluris]RAI77999.1 histidine kinase [Spirosoma telluris]
MSTTFLNETLKAQQLESFQEVIPVAVLHCQPVIQHNQVVDFRYVWGNRMALQMSALSPTEFGQMTMLRLFPSFVDSGIFSRYVQVWETGDTVRFERQHPIGDLIHWVDVSVSKKFDGLVITAVDITGSKHAQQALERQTQLLQNIVKQLPAGLVLFHPIRNQGGEIIDFYYGLSNPVNDHTLGFSAGQLANRNLLEMYPSARTQGTFGRLKEVLQTGISKHYETQYQDDGVDLWLDGHMAKVDEGVLLIYLDITPLKRQQQALLEQASLLLQKNEQLHQSNEALARTNQRLQGLQAIERALLNQSLTGQEPQAAALRHARLLIPCERLVVYQFDDATNMAQARSWLVGGEMAIRTGSQLPIQLFTIEPLLSAQPMVIDILQGITPGIPPELGLYERGYRSMVIVPLFSQQQYIGAFVLIAHKPYFFTADYLQIAQEVGSQLAIVLRQQQLNQQLQQHTEQLEKRVQERTLEIWQLSTLQNAILKHAGQAIISTDIQGVILSANPASEKLLGYQVDELIGRYAQAEPGPPDNPIPILSYPPQGAARSPTDAFITALATHGHYYGECIAIGKDGQRIHILLASSVLQDEQGALIGYVGIATDITALKTAEIKLLQKNQEQNTFFDVALDMHCISDSQGNFLKTNPAFQIALGYSEAELMAIPFLQLFHPDEQKFVYRQLLSPILHQPVQNNINQMRRKDGTYRIIEWNAIGIDQLVYGSARDITERQRDEAQLRSLNQRLELATQAAGQGIWENDLIKDTLIWDDRLWQLYGLEPRPNGWNFKEFIKLIHPDDMAAFLEHSHQGIAGNKLSTINRIIRPDGLIRFIETNGLLIHDQQGRPIRSIGVAWDVTERKLAEEALRESEQRFHEIAENVDEVFWIHSADTFQLLYINPAYERVFGIVSPNDTSGTNSFLDTILEEDRPHVLIEFDKYQKGQKVTVQCRVKGSHKTIRWLQIRTFIMSNNQGVPMRYIGIANDITSQKEKELVLQQSLEREQELNQLKSQFVSTASHEFRTPLTTIQTSVDLINLYLDQPQTTATPFIQQYLGLIREQIQTINGLLSDLLSIGKIEAGKIAFQPDWGDVLILCQQIVDSHFSHEPDGRTVRISVEERPYRTYFDKKLISQVLANLLSNAFKFSKNDPQLNIRFQESELVIQVIDTGIGIPESDLPSLFQTFFRARNTATISGTGLGLVIARQYVELHGGKLTVQSEENKGTTFTIVLPNEPIDPSSS